MPHNTSFSSFEPQLKKPVRTGQGYCLTKLLVGTLQKNMPVQACDSLCALFSVLIKLFLLCKASYQESLSFVPVCLYPSSICFNKTDPKSPKVNEPRLLFTLDWTQVVKPEADQSKLTVVLQKVFWNNWQILLPFWNLVSELWSQSRSEQVVRAGYEIMTYYELNIIFKLICFCKLQIGCSILFAPHYKGLNRYIRLHKADFY